MAIRRVFHRQLKALWEVHPTLSRLMYCQNCGIQNNHIAEHLGTGIDGHELAHVKDYISKRFKHNGFNFCPLACEEFSLSCTLDILFLRHGTPSGTISGGDLDNRVKTLIDALSKPSAMSANDTPQEGEDPLFTLLQDDNQVSALTVQSDTLLEQFSDPDPHQRDAIVVIAVELRPYMPTHFNLAFA
jgi:hypothetical protein